MSGTEAGLLSGVDVHHNLRNGLDEVGDGHFRWENEEGICLRCTRQDPSEIGVAHGVGVQLSLLSSAIN
jgi:hypothetical protein